MQLLELTSIILFAILSTVLFYVVGLNRVVHVLVWNVITASALAHRVARLLWFGGLLGCIVTLIVATV